MMVNFALLLVNLFIGCFSVITVLKDVADNKTSTHTKIRKKSWKENPIVLMFTLTKWKLLKNPHFLLTALGSSYSFNALINFYLLLPLHAGSKGLSVEDKVLLPNT
jgi:hypothetical protein